MNADILTILGGVGLFLFGMHSMTGALQQIASRHVRQVLGHFTTSPLTGIATGAVTTAVIQSSSATMITVIGFVGAGLMSFTQSLGVIFGANIGTTMTGWMVLLLGFKLKLGLIAYALLFFSSLLTILARETWARAGLALAGFSLIFIGIEVMQTGMAAFQGVLTPDILPADTWSGRLWLLGLGMLITAVTQSSSAGVAAALVLLSNGSISFMQAAAMVIGMNIGTTVTALLATLGGSAAMRRTGIAHLIYNVGTGIVAYLLLSPVGHALEATLGTRDPQTALVAFHTLFNVIGVALFVPVIRPFARFLEWLVPARVEVLAEALDRHLLSDPAAAMDAARTASGRIMKTLFRGLCERLTPGGNRRLLQEVMPDIRVALEELDDFLARISVPDKQTGPRERLAALLHQADHLNRLRHRAEQSARINTILKDPLLQRPARILARLLGMASQQGSTPEIAARLARLEQLISRRVRRYRKQTLLHGAQAPVTPGSLFARTDAMRWLQRTTHHVERAVHYGNVAAQEISRAPGKESPSPAGG